MVFVVVEIRTSELFHHSGKERGRLRVDHAIGIGRAGEPGSAVIAVSDCKVVRRIDQAGEIAHLVITRGKGLAAGHTGIALHSAGNTAHRIVTREA